MDKTFSSMTQSSNDVMRDSNEQCINLTLLLNNVTTRDWDIIRKYTSEYCASLRPLEFSLFSRPQVRHLEVETGSLDDDARHPVRICSGGYFSISNI